MNKRVALVTLIKNSLVLPDEIKLDLLDGLPTMSESQIEALGVQLADERQFVLQHESYIKEYASDLTQELAKASDKVYVGSGKPS